MSVYIYVDDERKPDFGLMPAGMARIIARNYEETIHNIDHWSEFFNNRHMIYLDLDHDLGEGKTGYDICKYIVENQVKNVKYRIHSMNPVGRANMEQLMSHYGYEKF